MEFHFAFRLFTVALLIVVNGFFAGAEVALLSVRKTRLRELAREGRLARRRPSIC